MGFKNLKFVKPSKRLKVLLGSKEILELIEENFGKVVNRNDLKFIPSFVEYVCSLVEEAYNSKTNVDKQKVNKKEEVIKLIGEFLKVTLSEQDKKQLTELIEDLHSSGRIKKASYLSNVFFQLLNQFISKLK